MPLEFDPSRVLQAPPLTAGSGQEFLARWQRPLNLMAADYGCMAVHLALSVNYPHAMTRGQYNTFLTSGLALPDAALQKMPDTDSTWGRLAAAGLIAFGTRLEEGNASLTAVVTQRGFEAAPLLGVLVSVALAHKDFTLGTHIQGHTTARVVKDYDQAPSLRLRLLQEVLLSGPSSARELWEVTRRPQKQVYANLASLLASGALIKNSSAYELAEPARLPLQRLFAGIYALRSEPYRSEAEYAAFGLLYNIEPLSRLLAIEAAAPPSLPSAKPRRARRAASPLVQAERPAPPPTPTLPRPAPPPARREAVPAVVPYPFAVFSLQDPEVPEAARQHAARHRTADEAGRFIYFQPEKVLRLSAFERRLLARAFGLERHIYGTALPMDEVRYALQIPEGQTLREYVEAHILPKVGPAEEDQ